MDKIKTYSQFLNESVTTTKPQTKEEVLLWLEQNISHYDEFKESFVVNDDLSVDVVEVERTFSGAFVGTYSQSFINVSFSAGVPFAELPISFRNTPGALEFSIVNIGLKSVKGFPSNPSRGNYDLRYNNLSNIFNLKIPSNENPIYVNVRNNKLISLLTDNVVPLSLFMKSNFIFSDNPCSGAYNRHRSLRSEKEDEILQMHIDVLEQMFVRYKSKVTALLKEISDTNKPFLDRMLELDSTKMKVMLVQSGLLGDEIKNVYDKVSDIEGGYF